MNEIRWVTDGKGNMQLQFRTRSVRVDASGAFCQFTDWSEWSAVPLVHDEKLFRSYVDEFPGRESEALRQELARR